MNNEQIKQELERFADYLDEPWIKIMLITYLSQREQEKEGHCDNCKFGILTHMLDPCTQCSVPTLLKNMWQPKETTK